MATSLAAEEGWLEVGRRRLNFRHRLGEGASSVVWAAVDDVGCSYAMKVGTSVHQAERLAAEAECLAVARAPSMASVVGGGRLPKGAPCDVGEQGLPFLLLEDVPGGVSLEGAWSEVGWGALGAHEILRDIAVALEELHAVGRAHGDLKPSNVLVRGTGAGVAATLIDFGLSAEASARTVCGGTPRYLAPEVWNEEPQAAGSDGRARDLYALGLTLAELLIPRLRDASDLRAAVQDAALPEPYEGLLRPLLQQRPALRPSVRWLLSRAGECFGWGPGWAMDRRLRTVRREYLRVRQEEVLRASSAREVHVTVGALAGQWLRESLAVARAVVALRKQEATCSTWELGDSSRYTQRRWLVGVVGPSAAGWDWKAEPDERLAGELLALAEQGPLEGATRGSLGALQAEPAPYRVPADPIGLCLRLAELPVDTRVLEQIERLPDLHPELGVAAARAWRLRGEWARARLITNRFTVPTARLEGSLAARRLGEREVAHAELQAVADSDAEIASQKAAQLAREALDAGRLEEAASIVDGLEPTAALLETQALIRLAAGDVLGVRCSLEEARSRAASEEQRARLEGVAGLLAHAEARPQAALAAFQRAALHAERAGALLEEATYLTGVASAATDRGELGTALVAAERAILLFESLGRSQEGARAALARTAAYSLCGAEGELIDAAEDALARARAAGDGMCEGYVHLALADGMRSDSTRARAHAELAVRCLVPGSTEQRLRAATRLLEHGLAVDTAEVDTLALSAPSLEARLEWWGARAEAIHRGRLDGRADSVVETLLALAAEQEAGMVRGPALVRGARLALTLSRSDDARRLLAVARPAARELLAKTPEELRRHVQALDWVLLAETPERGQFASEQLEEVEALVRRLGGRERLKPLLEQVLDALLLWTGVERGLLLLRAPAKGAAAGGEAERLVVRAARNLAREDLQGPQLELSQSLAHRALERGAPVVAVDAAGELSEMHRSVHALKLRSVLAVPLIARGESQGVVYLDDRVRRGAFGAPELAWVKLVATLAAVAIADARDQLRLRRAARRAQRAEARMARDLARREVELELAERELCRTRDVRGDYSSIIGQSQPMLDLLRVVDRVAASEVPVLVQGESGSGKELIARAIHDNGPRRQRAFVAENCAAIPEPLLESTLFGHVRGAFTGAARQRAGLFEVAHGGTLFLDEIAEMPFAMQTKLLRALQEGEIRPVGSERARNVDVRVIAATHRDLKKRVETGHFREDLFYRLNVIALRVPSLRERSADVPLLLRKLSEVHAPGRQLKLEADALSALLRYAWPGNVRQLENEVRRLLVLTEGTVRLEHLSPEIQAAIRLPEALDTLHVRTRVDALERQLVKTALERTEGNQTRAAELLGLSRFGLQKMMKRLEVGNRTGVRERSRRRSRSGLQDSQ